MGSSFLTWTLCLDDRASWEILNLRTLKAVYTHPQGPGQSQASMVSPVSAATKAAMALSGMPGLASDTWLLSPPFSHTSLALFYKAAKCLCQR